MVAVTTSTSDFPCPHCARRIASAPDLAGTLVSCPHCARQFQMPGTRLPVPPPAQATKTCPFCAERISSNAIKCKHCGSMLVPLPGALGQAVAGPPTYPPTYPQPYPGPSIITTPLLISAIGNIVVGLIWLSTCFGVVFSVPMFILCAFEFNLYSKADTLGIVDLSRRAKTLAIFEVVVGLFNTVSFVCGILLLINAPKAERQSYSAARVI